MVSDGFRDNRQKMKTWMQREMNSSMQGLDATRFWILDFLLQDLDAKRNEFVYTGSGCYEILYLLYFWFLDFLYRTWTQSEMLLAMATCFCFGFLTFFCKIWAQREMLLALAMKYKFLICFAVAGRRERFAWILKFCSFVGSLNNFVF